MRNFETLVNIANALKDADWKIKNIDFEHGKITISRFYSIIDIAIDVVECRLNITELNHPSCYRYTEYRESATDEELSKFILSLINEFRHENYRLTVINRYGYDYNGHDRLDDSYFPDDASCLRRLLDCDDIDNETLFSLDEHITQYPNPAMRLKVKRLDKCSDIAKKYEYLGYNRTVLFFELTSLEYKKDEHDKVTDELKESKTYYAVVTINDTK